MKKIISPTEAELEILQILWEKHPESVRYVHEQLVKKKDIRYTTTLKQIQIMTEKKLLRRIGEGRKHVYEPVTHKTVMQDKLLGKFLKSTFDGSVSKMVLQALGSHKPSKEELEEIKGLIKNLESNE